MRPLAFLTLFLVTSATACRIGVRAGLRLRGLGPTLRRTLETVGLGVVFLVANLVVTIVAVLGLRAAGVFVSIYVGSDPMIPCLSFVQALLFQHWRYVGRGGPG